MHLNFFKQKDIISQQLLSYLLFEYPLSEGGKLPPASTLAEKFGVSIVTIREILKSMESIGILSMQHGRGIFLNHPATILQEMIGTRILIESHCAGLAAANLTEDDAAELNSYAALMEEAHLSGNMDLYTDADFQFHMKIAGAGRNLVLEKTLRNIRIFLYIQQKETNNLLLTSNKKSLIEHKNILKALIDRDSEHAGSAMKSHLEETQRLWDRAR